jgi:hypothetical protein
MGAKTFLAGLATACVACCTIPLIGGLSIGAGLAGIGFGVGFGWGGWVLLLLAGVAVAGAITLRRSLRSPALAVSSGCGCGPRPAGEARGSEDGGAMPIACTLTGDDFAHRTRWIRQLASEHLLSVSRSPLSLRLTYAPAAAGLVRDLVVKEQACCAFLTFDLRESDTAIDLVVTAPKEAGDAVNLLFDHFAPHAVAGK